MPLHIPLIAILTVLAAAFAATPVFSQDWETQRDRAQYEKQQSQGRQQELRNRLGDSTLDAEERARLQRELDRLRDEEYRARLEQEERDRRESAERRRQDEFARQQQAEAQRRAEEARAREEERRRYEEEERRRRQQSGGW